jgi:predicted ribosomally synthesized peptide with SipW-like signal peptide
MKSFMITIFVIGALVAAGIGGTLASFSDYEVSQNNSFEMGEMDLVVSDNEGCNYNGDIVPAVFAIDDGWPDCIKSQWFDLHNAGRNEQENPYVYLHFKNLTCEFQDAKEAYEYIKVVGGDIVRCPSNDPLAIAINEPTAVAIFGGIAGENATGATVTVDGIGDDAICMLSRYISVNITYSIAYDSNSGTRPTNWDEVPANEQTVLDLSAYDTAGNNDGKVQLSEIACEQLEIGDLKGCWMRFVLVEITATDVPESAFNLNHFDETNTDEAKWEDWPTNAMQAQKVTFDLAFELLQY